MNEWKRSGKIPAFGNWDDFTNELPITRYFECAREAGLVRYSSSSAETANNISHSNKPLPLPNHNKQERRKRERRVTGNKKKKGNGGNGKVYDARKPIRVSKTKSEQLQQNDTVPKPVDEDLYDEDLYEIPPEVLHKTNKRMCDVSSRKAASGGGGEVPFGNFKSVESYVWQFGGVTL